MRIRDRDTDLYDSPADHEDPADGGPVSVEREAAEEAPVRRRSKFAELMLAFLSGNILSRSEVRRAYPYMMFVAVLAFFYIANAFTTQRLYRRHAELTEQVRELRARSMSVASDRMKATRQSVVIGELRRRGIGLHESLAPNKVIPRDGDER